VRGFPIRTSSDQRSVGSSPRLIAASYVLHRLLVPRHPPCALNNLATQLQPDPTPPAAAPARPEGARRPRPANTRACNQRRCSRPLCSSQRPTGHRPLTPPPTPPPAPTTGATTTGGTRTRTAPTQSSRPPARTPRPGRGPLPQDPTACLPPPPPDDPVPHPLASERAVLGAGGGRRPNWSAFHPRAPPQEPAAPRSRETVTPWARLCTTSTGPAASAP
jgi:hypothetical protein